jgi:plasmid stabilization system protein ParE
MKVVFTVTVLRDLDEISGWLADHHPALAPAVERRIRARRRAHSAMAGERAPIGEASWRARCAPWPISLLDILSGHARRR